MMSFGKYILFILSMIISIAFHAAIHAEPLPEKAPKYADVLKEAKQIPWITEMKSGSQKALADRKPVLIYICAKRSAPCRKMAVEMETPAVQEELTRWIPIYLDMDAKPKDAESLGISTLPSLRICTPGGELKASQDGYLSTADLVDWLKKYYDEAMAPADNLLLENTEPDAGVHSQPCGTVSAARSNYSRGGHSPPFILSAACQAGSEQGIHGRQSFLAFGGIGNS